MERGLQQPLLITEKIERSSEEKERNGDDDDGDAECDESEEAPEESRKPVTSFASAYRLLTPSIKVCNQMPSPAVTRTLMPLPYTCHG